jgi:hypothetical protein
MVKHVFFVFVSWLLLTMPFYSFSQRLIGFEITGDSLLKGFDVILEDPLTSNNLSFGEVSKFSFLGNFSKNGWQSEHTKGFIKIGISDLASGEGALQVTLTNLFQNKSNRISTNEKGIALNPINFINMFSDESGDFLHEKGISKNSCFWSLGFPTINDRSLANDNFQIIWSSIGYKNAPSNRFSEKFNLPPENWKWDKKEYTFIVIWSKNEELLKVYVNGHLFYKVDWYGQEQPFGFVYLGKCGLSNSLQDVYFRDLKIFEK